jgi:outer membrane protein OmpA-like peptidoglycan-associated protein
MRPRLSPRVAVFFALLAQGAIARAQSAPPTGWALNRFEPAPAGERFFAAQHPTYGGGAVVPRFGLTFDYAHNPLIVRDRTQGTSASVLRAMLVGHLQAGLVFDDRFNVHLSLPISLLQDGPAPNLTGVSAAAAPAPGDVRFGARVRVFGQAETRPFSVHVGGEVFLPATLFGTALTDNVSDGNIRGRAYVVLAGRVGAVRWSATGGYHGRPETATFGGRSVASEAFATAGLAWVSAGGKLSLGPEAYLSAPVGGAASGVSSELIVGAHYHFTDALSVGVGAGPGLTAGLGTPTFRGLASVTWAPQPTAPAVPADTDRDGVPDATDVCVNTPRADRPHPARTGCPVRDRDRDGVFDLDDLCADDPSGERPDPERAGCPQSDADHDHVPDAQDQCVDVAAGASPDPARAGCPEDDRDHDGVRDSDDACAEEAAGDHPDPARIGCPTLDRDGDSVADVADHCPDEAGTPSPEAERNGCPGMVQVQSGQLVLVDPVYFATGRDVILERSFPVLDAVAGALRASPNIRRVSVEGHTDDVHTDEANVTLSERRANNVVAFLVAHGVDASRLEAHGFGESRPVRPLDGLDPQQTEAARAVNRRVEFRIVDPATEAAPEVAPVTAPEIAPEAAPEPAPIAAPAPSPHPETPARPRHHRRHRAAPAPQAAPPAAPIAHAPPASAPAMSVAPVSRAPASAPMAPGPRRAYTLPL